MKDLIESAVKKASGIGQIKIDLPENIEFGDYSTNVALKTDKAKGEDVGNYAKKLVEKLRTDGRLQEFVSKIEVAGGGFINFYLSERTLLDELSKIVSQKAKYGSSSLGEGKTVVIDYSSPNIAKAFSIAHLRSTVIGQALYNLHKFLGYKVIGDNHLGDWGTQFGALLAQIRSTKSEIRKLTVDNLEELYVDFHKKAEKNPELWDEARAWFKKLEDGDNQARDIWKKVTATSLAEFERIYELLKVKIDHAYGESFYEDKMPSVVAELKKKGLLKKSQGAQIVELNKMPPGIIIKKDGASTYLTRDLATIKFRLETFDPQIIIYEVGSDQTLHFKQVFAIAEMLDWSKNREFVHIGHGLMRFEHGKMSTRKGQTVKLDEVLAEAISRAKKTIEASETPRLRSGQAGRGLSAEEKESVAEAVGVGAIKYFDLMHHPTSDIVFDWEKIFILQGSSGPYLQYTAVRADSVLRRAELPITNLQFSMNFKPNTEELRVLRNLIRFPEIVKMAATSYSPNTLTKYLFELAQKFNNFYDKNRIIGSDNGDFRLELTRGVQIVMTNGLTLLGIDTPERM
jgi:arginyl-tRNA synthetase